jgi:hypothetical protein
MGEPSTPQTGEQEQTASSNQTGDIAGMLVKNAIQSSQQDDSQRALNYLEVVDQELTPVPYTINRINNGTSSGSPQASSGEFNCEVQTKGGVQRGPCE